MARLRGRCPTCGDEIEITVFDGLLDGLIVWYAVSDCTTCGLRGLDEQHEPLAHEGPLPDQVRRPILAEDGEWTLLVEESEPRSGEAGELLRKALELSDEQVAELKERIPGPVMSGTWAEMEQLRLLLKREGYSAALRWPDVQAE